VDMKRACYYVSPGVLVMTFPILENFEPFLCLDRSHEKNESKVSCSR